MDSNRDKGRRGLGRKFAEYAIGLGLLCSGWNEATQIGSFPFRVIFIFLAGSIFIACATLKSRLEQKIRNIDGFLHILEGLVTITCASILLEKDKHWIPLFLAFIGLLYLTKGLTQFLTMEKNGEKVSVQFRIIQGVAFIVFGAAAIVVNAITDRMIAVYVISMFMVLSGIFILLRHKSLNKKKIGGC